ncbi:hypothetical protein MLD38_007988 [Melastoma candidum]|uniref:Uncharacterized protein n=1 Tax=Melastoma candidum TaxID=119954 RepID=A0ACB9RSI0_9MYRT|nr:hypothetical protein MLD38_007988 [Melastoma candidum]
MSLSITKRDVTSSQTVLLLPAQTASEVSTSMLSPSVMSDHGKDSIHEISEPVSPRSVPQADEEAEMEVNGRIIEYPAISELQFPKDLAIALMSEEWHKMRRLFTSMRQRLTTAKTGMEDLIVRFNQEAAFRQFLTTKVKDLEAEFETTRYSCKENAIQSTFIEKEKFTKMQWDVEEHRKKCLETEIKFKSEQDERARTELARRSLLQDRDMMLIELDGAREQIDNLQKHNEELEAKTKAEIKVLVKEVKSLRSSQVEWKHQLSQLLGEKIELRELCRKKNRRRKIPVVNFLVEEEDELIVDTSSPSDPIDLLTTCDNRIGLLLAELLAEDVENAAKSLDQTPNATEVANVRTSDYEIRKMLTDIFIDNATLRKQVNTVIRCALNIYLKNEKEGDGDDEVPLRKTVLSKFLER